MARQRYYSTTDVANILQVSRTKALQIMHMFEYRGKLFRNGRLLRVKVTDFDEWLQANTKVERWN